MNFQTQLTLIFCLSSIFGAVSSTTTCYCNGTEDESDCVANSCRVVSNVSDVRCVLIFNTVYKTSEKSVFVCRQTPKYFHNASEWETIDVRRDKTVEFVKACDQPECNKKFGEFHFDFSGSLLHSNGMNKPPIQCHCNTCGNRTICESQKHCYREEFSADIITIGCKDSAIDNETEVRLLVVWRFEQRFCDFCQKHTVEMYFCSFAPLCNFASTETLIDAIRPWQFVPDEFPKPHLEPSSSASEDYKTDDADQLTCACNAGKDCQSNGSCSFAENSPRNVCYRRVAKFLNFPALAKSVQMGCAVANSTFPFFDRRIMHVFANGLLTLSVECTEKDCNYYEHDLEDCLTSTHANVAGIVKTVARSARQKFSCDCVPEAMYVEYQTFCWKRGWCADIKSERANSTTNGGEPSPNVLYCSYWGPKTVGCYYRREPERKLLLAEVEINKFHGKHRHYKICAGSNCVRDLNLSTFATCTEIQDSSPPNIRGPEEQSTKSPTKDNQLTATEVVGSVVAVVVVFITIVIAVVVAINANRTISLEPKGGSSNRRGGRKMQKTVVDMLKL